MPKAKVHFIIDNDGNYLTDTEGIKGQKCTNLDKLFASLGEVKSSKTSEFYENEQPNDVNIVGGQQN